MEKNIGKGKLSFKTWKVITFIVFSLSVYLYLFVVSTKQKNIFWGHIREFNEIHSDFEVIKRLQLISNGSSFSKEKTWTNSLEIPLLTLFTTWRVKAEKLIANNNTVRNWKSLAPAVIPVLFTNDTGVGISVKKLGWDVLPVPKIIHDIPVIKDMYLEAMAKYKSHFYCYANGDILFTNTLVQTIQAILNSSLPLSEPMLITGRRTNVIYVTQEEASNWKRLQDISKSRGSLFASYAEDYFITSSNYPWEHIPDIVVGRRGYDNWLVLNNRKRFYTTVDATSTLLAVHQTTKSGNFENQKSSHNLYNINLLSKLYKSINYDMGLTGCAENFTKFTNGYPVVSGRKPPKGCGNFL